MKLTKPKPESKIIYPLHIKASTYEKLKKLKAKHKLSIREIIEQLVEQGLEKLK